MTNIQIKSEEPTIFDGIFSIIVHFDAREYLRPTGQSYD